MPSAGTAMNAVASGGLGRRPSARVLVAAMVWLAAVGSCMAVIGRYSVIPDDAGAPPAHWPVESAILPDPHLPTLVMFAHPRCPCTRATLGELDLLMARVAGRVNAQVWFLKPENTAENWTNTDLWSTAAAIQGVTVHEDRQGSEAARFHAATSGQTLLYAADGRLLFQGGITIARGHAGDNPGRSALAGLVLGPATQAVKTPVFGCALFEKQCDAGGGSWKP